MHSDTTGLCHLEVINASRGSIHKYGNLKRKLYNCNANIYFNQQCLRKQLIPTYTKIKAPYTSPAFKYTQRKVPNLRIKDEIKYLMFIGPCIIVIVEEWKTNLMSLAILYHFLCAQHVLDINMSIIRSLRLCCWITTSVVLFSVRCVLEIWCGWFWGVPVVLQPAKWAPLKTQPQHISNTQWTENKMTYVVIQQHSRKLLMMDILMSETCWAHKKWYKIASDIKLVFHSSTIPIPLLDFCPLSFLKVDF
jgi:hypothetical protein